jgi:hypothetical protein
MKWNNNNCRRNNILIKFEGGEQEKKTEAGLQPLI